MKPCSLFTTDLLVNNWDVEAAFQLRTHGHLFSSNSYTPVKTTEHWEEQLSASTLLGTWASWHFLSQHKVLWLYSVYEDFYAVKATRGKDYKL